MGTGKKPPAGVCALHLVDLSNKSFVHRLRHDGQLKASRVTQASALCGHCQGYRTDCLTCSSNVVVAFLATEPS